MALTSPGRPVAADRPAGPDPDAALAAQALSRAVAAVRTHGSAGWSDAAQRAVARTPRLRGPSRRVRALGVAGPLSVAETALVAYVRAAVDREPAVTTARVALLLDGEALLATRVDVVARYGRAGRGPGPAGTGRRPRVGHGACRRREHR